MVENRMVVDSEWNDWLTASEDPYENAKPSNIIAFLINKERLHEVVARFIDADPGHYDEWKAEQLLLEYMTADMCDNLIKRYVAEVDIADEYNEWWRMYHN